MRVGTTHLWSLTLLAAAALTCCAAPPAEEASSSSEPAASPLSRPNIVLMLSDDQGWGDVEYAQERAPGDVYPGHPELKTPELAAMAQAGLRFHRMYSAGSNCSPTRASFITGRAPRRNAIEMAYSGGMRNLELTIAELAKTQGYMTGHFGKWHLGDLDRADERDGGNFARCAPNRGSTSPGCQGTSGGEFYSAPWHHGYDRSFASPQALPTFEPMRRDQAGPLPSEGNFHGGHYFTGHREYVDIDSADLSGDASAILVREATRFIDDATAAGRPFLAVLWFHPPHVPHRLDQATLDEFYTPEEQSTWNEYEARYYSGMTAMDREIGRLRAYLRDRGIEKDTLVTFTSDNGLSGSVRMDYKSEGKGGLRGFKGSIWEGGVRVPGIIEWPGRIAPGETHTPMITSDYLPTLADIWGLEMPDARPLDGESMTEVLFGDRTTQRKGRVAFSDCDDPVPVRGDDELDDCDSAGRGRGGRGLSRVGGGRSIMDHRYKLISVTSGREWELYDLHNDPREETPVATLADIDSKPTEIQTLFHSLHEGITSWFEVEAAASYAGEDYDTRIASAEGADILGDTGDPTVPDDLAASRRTAADRPELVVERQFATLEEDLRVDSDGAAAAYDAGNLPAGATIPSGTVVHSYLFHFAPKAATDLGGVEIELDDPIVGVAAGSASLSGSDFLAFANPDFGTSSDRGTLVGEPDFDGWKVLEGGKKIIVDTRAGGDGVDQLRILTRAALQRVR